MAGLKQIKSQIRSTDKTRTVTKAMEAVSAAKMRKAQAKAIAGRAYARAAAMVLARVSGSRAMTNHPLATWREPKRALYVVITADRGLAGALNSAVLRATYADIGALRETASVRNGLNTTPQLSRRHLPFKLLSNHQRPPNCIKLL